MYLEINFFCILFWNISPQQQYMNEKLLLWNVAYIKQQIGFKVSLSAVQQIRASLHKACMIANNWLSIYSMITNDHRTLTKCCTAPLNHGGLTHWKGGGGGSGHYRSDILEIRHTNCKLRNWILGLLCCNTSTNNTCTHFRSILDQICNQYFILAVHGFLFLFFNHSLGLTENTLLSSHTLLSPQ